MRLLTARAMLAVQEGRIDDAGRDLFACHRLARLVGQGPWLIDLLIGHSLEGMAITAHAGVLRSRKLSEAKLIAWQKTLDALPPIPSVISKIDFAERISMLDTATYCSRNPRDLFKILSEISAFSEVGQLLRKQTGKALRRAIFTLVDWNSVLEMINDEFDRQVTAAKMPRYADQKIAMEKYHKRLVRFRVELLDERVVWRKLLLGTDSNRSLVTDTMAKLIVVLMSPAFTQCLNSEERAATRMDLARIGVALERYRKANSRYPTKLSDLKPKFIKKLPVDYYSEKSYIYKRSKSGYLLYSVGTNQKDDGGRNLNTETDDDDILLKMERPQ